MLNLDPAQYRHLTSLLWDEVFDIWRQNEANNPAWVEHYTSKGYNSWEEWRDATHAPIKGDEREWHMYQVQEPLVVVPTFRGGPFKSWKRMYFAGKQSPPFSDLITHPGLQHHDGLENLIANFPQETTISGLVVGDDIYVIEGMHRCCAIALAAQRRLDLACDLKIVLAEYPAKALPELDTDKKEQQ